MNALVAHAADEVNLLCAGSLVGLMEHGVGLRSHFAWDKQGSHMELFTFRSGSACFGVDAPMPRIRVVGELHGASSLQSRIALCQSNLTPGSEEISAKGRVGTICRSF